MLPNANSPPLTGPPSQDHRPYRSVVPKVLSSKVVFLVGTFDVGHRNIREIRFKERELQK